MPTARHFTVELGPPANGWGDVQAATARARHAAEQMRAEGRPVRFLRSIFVPEEGACFFLYSGPSAAAVGEAARRAELGVRHVRKTITEVEQ